MGVYIAKRLTRRQHMKPPQLADRLLAWFCAPHLLEEVQGDLHERYSRDVRMVGVRTANGRYWLNVRRFMRPFAI